MLHRATSEAGQQPVRSPCRAAAGVSGLDRFRSITGILDRFQVRTADPPDVFPGRSQRQRPRQRGRLDTTGAPGTHHPACPDGLGRCDRRGRNARRAEPGSWRACHRPRQACPLLAAASQRARFQRLAGTRSRPGPLRRRAGTACRAAHGGQRSRVRYRSRCRCRGPSPGRRSAGPRCAPTRSTPARAWRCW